MVHASFAQPKLRTDLVICRQEAPEGTCFVVKDPVAGQFFRLKETEHFIWQQLDGSTPLEVVRQMVEEKFGAPAAPGALEHFVEQLRRLGLLEGERGAGHLTERRRRVRGNLFYLRLKAFDPDRLFGRLVGKVAFFFTPYFLVLSAALILFAIGIAVVKWGEITRDFAGLYRFQALVLAWLTVLAVTTAHELAHGLTCKRFGGEVHEIGFMLIYFQPAFYCNVSDAWLFPEKSRRLWVTFAGAYFEIFLWALATVTWRLTEPATWPNFLALVVMATSGIKTLFNLNPLIKLDGYYLLSDYLEIPNLRQRAFGYLRGGWRRLSGSAGQRVTEATPRLRGALRTGSTLFKTGQRRMASLKRPGMVLAGLAAALALLFLGRMELTVSGAFKIVPRHNADVRAEVEGLIQEIRVDEGDRVKKGDLIARLSDRDYRAELRKIEAEIEEKQAKLRMLRAGPRSEEIQVARKEVETARTRHEHALRRYEEAKRMRAERLSKAKTTVEKAEERLKYARNNLARVVSLFKGDLISRKEFEEVEEQVAVRGKERDEAQAELEMVLANDLAEVRKDVAVAEKELAQAEGRVRVLLAGSRPEEMEGVEAEIARLEAQRRYVEEQLDRVRVVSPVSGVVTSPRLKEKIGQHVQKGDLIAEVHALKTVTAEIAVSEKEIADVRVGQPVILKVRAYPEKSFAGTVTAVAPAAAAEEPGGGGTVLKVTTEIDNASGLLKSEMTGNAKIFSDKRRIIDVVTRRLARYIRVEVWSWW